MSAAIADRVDPAVALRTLRDAVDGLQAADWGAGSDEELLASLRELETLKQRLATVDHALIIEVEARRLPASLAYRSPASLLRAVLRLHPYEASARVRAAEAAASRRTLTGAALEPAYPLLARAQAAGAVSPRHAEIVVRTVERLPDRVRQEKGAEIEADLVDWAQRFDPDQLAKLTKRLLFFYDQDGPDPSDGYDQRRRFLHYVRREDGSGHGEFDLAPEAMELLLVHLDALAAPRPAVDGERDPRTVGQRRHDALLESLKLVVKARALPTVNGVTATVVVTMTKRQYETGQGLARTSHGALIPAREALRWGQDGGDLRLLAVAIGKMRPVEAYGTTARLYTETQRLVMHAVHAGCTFPHCDSPPSLTEAHHTIDYALGGETSVNTGAPVCADEHRDRIAQGWRSEVIGDRVAWIPPPSIDPAQQPQYNDLHLPGLLHPTDEGQEQPDDG